ncbi:MAG TPA: HutD family protein, partial [Mycobacterium sp.]|nr:HutD family protein [Mycobacterium sp.]
MRLVHPTQVRPERWANGGGWTRTLLAWPDPRRWSVRVSVADVETAGPFSAYPGVDRWFAVLEGGGVRLTTAGRAPASVRADDDEMHAF